MGLYHSPQSQEEDSSGNPLNGAKLFFYEVGSSTKKTVYSNKGMTIQHTNPVVADAAGRFDAIYTDGAYKVILTTSGDTDPPTAPIWTEDNISYGAGDIFGETETVTSTTAIDSTYDKKHIRVTGATTLNLLDLATAGTGFTISVINDGVADVTIDPNASEQINDALTLVLKPGDGALIIAGEEWSAIVTRTSLVSDSTPQLGGDLDTNGHQIQWSKGADVASASELPILTDGNYYDVTGTTPITSIATTGKVGTFIKLHFDAALVLAHHATDLILPGGFNITTAAGDEAEFIEYASGDFRCTNYQHTASVPFSTANIAAAFKDKVLSGLIMSNGTDATNDINVTAGSCVSDDGTTIMTMAARTLETDSVFDDTGNKGLDTGVVGNNTYHVWVINRPDTNVTKVIVSLSASSPTLLAAYTKKKCIGSIIRLGGTVLGFIQNGNRFMLAAPQQFITGSANSSTTATNVSTLGPLGFKFTAIIMSSYDSNVHGCVRYSDPDLPDVAPTAAGGNGQIWSGANGGGGEALVVTNTSAQVRWRSVTASRTVNASLDGWIDPRI